MRQTPAQGALGDGYPSDASGPGRLTRTNGRKRSGHAATHATFVTEPAEGSRGERLTRGRSGGGPRGYRVGGGRIRSRPARRPDDVHGFRALTVASGTPKYLAMLKRLSPERTRYSQQSGLSGQAVSRAYRSELGAGVGVGLAMRLGVGVAVAVGCGVGLDVGAWLGIGGADGATDTSTLGPAEAAAVGTTATALADGAIDPGAAAAGRSSPPRAKVNTTAAENAAASNASAPIVAGVILVFEPDATGSTSVATTAPRR